MDSVNELIVKLVTASNDVETVDRNDLSRLVASATAEIQRLAPSHPASGQETLQALEKLTADGKDASAQAWQAALRQAAETLRALQPMIDPERGLPAHRPDGGDGGNY
jgi:hypothetical protein